MAAKKFRRNTQQRQVILEELQSLQTHPTATELYEKVRQRLPKISLGTVYRNLELLSQGGLVHKLEFAGTEARFDGQTMDHFHVRCTQCGRLDDVHELQADLIQKEPNELGGYEILGHRLEFIGICPECREQKAAQTHTIPSAVGD
jgi:Fur family ferric uptake transcriptional regulator